ncbi:MULTISPECIES: PstS family phosphate ABC transporter substrate-binding protein [Exiguobacterium]|uniref:PstS family phosphate ABC transporter substrate-binding protein n=1 Tax=Exiguobacterium TaxID=33986 RepID=UPI001BE53D0B|nr:MULTISPECIES: substrate-binding domain-containing protein [Exiguobacterium]MCT4778098.1 substrate-binding domain-containing protein [Exiguobacterium aquaticum]MCT4789060.1 substrate-binding domain-containing protein [Exiguobacterium mexicanum]
MKIVKFILGSVMIVLVTAVISVFTALFTMGNPIAGGRSILWTIWYVAALLILIMALYDFSSLTKGQLKRVGLIGTVIGVVFFGSVKGYYVYTEGLRIEERGVELYDYQPFKEESDLAELDAPSSFKIDSNLPRLDGATALYPLYASFVEAVYPSDEYNPYSTEESPVVSTTTGEAYDRLIQGKTDIIFVAGPSDLQVAAAEKAGMKFNMTPIGREAFVFFVHEDNPVDSLKLDEIQQVYAGDIDNWSEVGGENDPIRAFQRPEGSGSQTALQRMMGNRKLMDAPVEDVPEGMGGIIEQTAAYTNHKNAIGFSFRFYATEMVEDHDIKLLQVNGIAPTIETIADGTYPITSEFYAITTEEQYETYKPFLDWMTSEEGQTLVERTGYVPLAKD